MAQVIPTRLVGITGNSAGTFTPPCCPFSGGGNYFETGFEQGWSSHLWAVDGNLIGIYAERTVAPGGTASETYTFRKGSGTGAASDTAAAFTFGSGDTTASWTGTLALTDTDWVSLKRVATNSPATGDLLITYIFEPDDGFSSQYGHGSWNSRGSGVPGCALSIAGGPSGFFITPGSGVNATDFPMVIPGAWTMLRFAIDVVEAVDVACHFVKNGVVQDGSGGTVDTRAIITAGQTLGSATFTLNVVPGDLIGIQRDGAGGGRGLRYGGRFTATTADQFMIGGGIETNQPSQSSPSASMVGGSSHGWTTTESDVEVSVGGLAGIRAVGLSVYLTNDPNTGNQYSYTLRKEGADTSITGTIANAATTLNTSGAVVYAANDRLSMLVTPTSTPDTGRAFWVLGFGELAEAILKVTQLVVLVFTDEYEDEDIPPVADPCAGGGEVPTGSNPSAGTSLADATSPEFYLEIDLGGASPSTLKIAKGPVTTSTGVTEPIVTSWSDLPRSAVDPSGRHQSAYFDVTVFDPQAILRGPMDDVWSGASSSDALVERNARFYGRASSGATAQLLFQGVIRSAEIDDMSVRLSIEDALSVKALSIFSDEMLVPKQLITAALTDDTPTEEMLDKPIPLAYGSLSDEALGDAANGVVPLHFVKTVDGKDVFLGCLGAVTNIQSVFGADFASEVDEPTNRMKFGDSAWGSWAWAPHKPNWSDISPDPWYEVDGKRYTAVLVDHEKVVARLAREKRIPLSMNICGYEDVGDGSGVMIDSLERQFLHFLVNFVWGDYDGSGDWETSIPSLGSYSAIDTASFETCKDAGEDMFGDYLTGAFVLGWDLQQRPALDIMAQFCRSGGFEYAINQYGQLHIFRLNTTEDASAITARTALEHVIKGSLKITPSREQQVDLVPFVYARNYLPALADLAPDEGARLPKDPYQGKWLSGSQTYDTGTGGTKRAATLELEMVRDEDTAEWVAEQYGDLFNRPRLIAEWTERLGATGLEIGSVQKLTHFKATGTSGWTDRRVQIRTNKLRPDSRTVAITARDCDDLLP